jgi:hypothetical protein
MLQCTEKMVHIVVNNSKNQPKQLEITVLGQPEPYCDKEGIFVPQELYNEWYNNLPQAGCWYAAEGRQADLHSLLKGQLKNETLSYGILYGQMSYKNCIELSQYIIKRCEGEFPNWVHVSLGHKLWHDIQKWWGHISIVTTHPTIDTTTITAIPNTTPTPTTSTASTTTMKLTMLESDDVEMKSDEIQIKKYEANSAKQVSEDVGTVKKSSVVETVVVVIAAAVTIVITVLAGIWIKWMAQKYHKGPYTSLNSGLSNQSR